MIAEQRAPLESDVEARAFVARRNVAGKVKAPPGSRAGQSGLYLGFRRVLKTRLVYASRRGLFACLGFGLPELLFPTCSSLPPKRTVSRVDGLPLELAALLDLFLEELLFIK